MRGLVITNKYAQPLVIKRLGMDRSCLADSNNYKKFVYALKLFDFAIVKSSQHGTRRSSRGVRHSSRALLHSSHAFETIIFSGKLGFHQ